jgi:DNA invertase Pin-like site-specific DNA recombinase
MTHNSILAHHLERLAFVYVRQSGVGQVRKNRESGKRQVRMQQHVERLGWPAAHVRLLGGDNGRSGSSQHGRDDYHTLLEAVLKRTAGIIAVSELSRLSRDDQDWSQLIRICRYHDVLLADEHRLYDPKISQDRALLGMHGTFSELELGILIERMSECRRQKALRGELYEGFSPGYVCRRPPYQEKHPDQRVQRAVQKIFDDFDRQPSVYALFRQLQGEQFELPVVPPGQDWRDVQWKPPSYDTLLGMLRHPGYAGIYVRGRRKTVHELDEAGHVQRRERRVPREEWEVFLPEHHEAYISRERWEQNMAKISSNATHRQTGATKGAPARGVSLLAGLLRCRRCGRRLHVRYSRGVRYVCRAGVRQRGLKNKQCFSFAGSDLERQVEALLLEVVRPAGIAAAERAAEQLAADRTRQRTAIADRVSAAHEAEARAAREYKTTDETYLEVRRKLAAEWDAALQKVHEAQRRLDEFDAAQPSPLSGAERAQLEQLSTDLDRVWNDARADGVLRKQIVRTLIEEIVVDLDDEHDVLTFWVHWSGGHHTDHQIVLRRRGGRARRDLCATVSALRKILPDSALATALNRAGLTTTSGESWTARRVASFRRQHKIASYSASERERKGWLTQAEAATCLQISPMSVSRLVLSGILPAEQPNPGLPTVIQASDLDLPIVKRAISALKSHHNGPLPADPNQLILFKPDDF